MTTNVAQEIDSRAHLAALLKLAAAAVQQTHAQTNSNVSAPKPPAPPPPPKPAVPLSSTAPKPTAAKPFPYAHGTGPAAAAAQATPKPAPPAPTPPPQSSGSGIGNTIWNYGGKHLWNYGGKQVVNTGFNTLHGIGTTAVGAANLAAGGVGNVVSGVGYGLGAASDAVGATNDAKGWVADNMWRHTNNAVFAGGKDLLGGAADVLTAGAYDHDGTFAAPGQTPGTSVEQMRSGMRDELGRGSGLETTFNGVNFLGDVAASSAGFGAAGRGLNVAAKALQGSQAAAPVLNTVANTPVVGKPLAAAGNWLAGPAPAANMFQQGAKEYYQTAAGLGQPGTLGTLGEKVGPTAARVGAVADSAGRIAVTGADEALNGYVGYQELKNPTDRPADARAYKEFENQVHSSLTAASAPDATPEQKQIAQNDFQTWMQHQADTNPQHSQGAKDLMTGASTPEAKAFREHLESTGNDVMDAELKRLYDQNPNPTPEQAGGFYAQAANAWNGLGTSGQIMVGLGASAGLVALLMSMMGGEGGGMGGMLAAVLGLGAAGLGLAGSGAFGQGGQDFVGNMIGSAGQASGLIPKQLTPDQKAILTAKDPVAAAIAQSGGLMTREQAAKKIEETKTQLGQLGMLNNLGGMQNSIYQRMGLSPEEAQLAAKNTGLLTNAYNDQNSALNAKLRYGAEYADPNKSGIGGDVANMMAHGWDWLRGKQGSENMNIAQQIWMQHQMMKAARCWAGYEPVPGKAPYSNDSCRPVGSKKKKDTKKEKKAEEASSGTSYFNAAKKELEPVVNGQKPSTENSEQRKVTPKKPATGENLHPAAALMQPNNKPKVD